MRIIWLSCVCILLVSCAGNQSKKQLNAVSSIGDVYAKSGRLADAEMYYAKAHALAPDQPILLNKLANSQVQQGKLGEAKESYKQLLKQSPNNKQVRYRLASVALSLGDATLALTQYKMLLKTNKSDTKALNGLGVLLDNMHRNKVAQACYKRALKFDPQNFSLLNNLGLSYALSGNVTAARNYLGKATENGTTERPKNNIALINDHFKKIKDLKKRKIEFDKDLLLKNVRTSPQLAREAVSLALTAC